MTSQSVSQSLMNICNCSPHQCQLVTILLLGGCELCNTNKTGQYWKFVLNSRVRDWRLASSASSGLRRSDKTSSYKLSLTVRGMCRLDLTITPTYLHLHFPPPTLRLHHLISNRLILIAVWSVWSLAAPLQAALVAHAFNVTTNTSSGPDQLGLQPTSRQTTFLFLQI